MQIRVSLLVFDVLLIVIQMVFVPEATIWLSFYDCHSDGVCSRGHHVIVIQMVFVPEATI